MIINDCDAHERNHNIISAFIALFFLRITQTGIQKAMAEVTCFTYSWIVNNLAQMA